MGCFDVACGISSLTIKSGDDCVLLFLLPHSNYHRFDGKRTIEIFPGTIQVFNDGPLGLYMPAFLPIRGKYNDYGSIEKIVMDETAIAIESFMGCKIHELVKIIHRGKYNHIQSDVLLDVYGKKNIQTSNKIDKPWLESLGFIFDEETNRFNHPQVPQAIKYDSEKGYVKLGYPICYATLTNSVASIHYTKPENSINWEVRESIQRPDDFLSSFAKHTKDTSYNSTGVLLALDPEKIDKANYAFRMSSMFIDGKVYAEMSERIRTNEYHNSHILDTYMDKYLMRRIGFDFVETIEDKPGRYSDITHWYTHKDAAGFKFSVNESGRSVQMYKVNPDGTLKEVSDKRNYFAFDPNGLAKMFKGETKNELDLSSLNTYSQIDHKWEKIAGILESENLKKQKQKDLEDRIDRSKANGETSISKEDMRELFSFSSQDSQTVQMERFNAMSYLAVPFVFDVYEKLLSDPTDEFKENCEKFDRFMISLEGINRYLIPSAHFSQHGEYADEVEFYKIILKVAKEKAKDRE